VASEWRIVADKVWDMARGVRDRELADRLRQFATSLHTVAGSLETGEHPAFDPESGTGKIEPPPHTD